MPHLKNREASFFGHGFSGGLRASSSMTMPPTCEDEPMTGSHFYSDASIADLYTWFANETRSSSAALTRLCHWIADTAAIWPLLDSLPGQKRQPNIFLAALRYLDAPLDPGPPFLEWVTEHWDAVRDVVLSRQTQTNEPGRCATLAPVIASLGERIALIEVGMSAGLCLFPDRYGYRWSFEDGRVISRGSADVTVIDCEVSGQTPPAYADYNLPNIVWRAGIDLNPLNPADPDDARWLRALVWPGQTERETRLANALEMAAGQDVLRVYGDALDELPGLIKQAPDDATVVVMHTALLQYFVRERRNEFQQIVSDLPVRWISNEGDRVLPSLRDKLTPWPGDPSFALALDGEPIARTGPHGQFLHWL